MHGDAVEDIEESKNIELSKIVDSLGSVAWIAIFNTFKNAFKDAPNAETLSLLQTNMCSRQVLTVAANLIVYSNNPDQPKLSEFAKPTISLTYKEDDEK